MAVSYTHLTGFFTSPHLIKINERIQIDREEISDDTFYDVFCEAYHVAQEMEQEGEGHPSYFEFLFGMGMKAFEKAGVEYIILETGLGGRLDATNAVESPVLTVITSISLDHTAIPVSYTHLFENTPSSLYNHHNNNSDIRSERITLLSAADRAALP